MLAGFGNKTESIYRPLTAIAAASCLCAVCCAITDHARQSVSAAQLPEPPALQALLNDRQTVQGHQMTRWSSNPPAIELDAQPLPLSSGSLRSIQRQPAPLSVPNLTPFVEMWTGDRLPGRPIRFMKRDEQASTTWPDHLVIQTPELSVPGESSRESVARVRATFVRHLVWTSSQKAIEPGTLVDQQGRRVRFRAWRWNQQSVTVLTSEGRRDLPFDQLAEVCLPATNPWPLLLAEQAALTPQIDAPWVQIETAAGILVTPSWHRLRNIPQDDPTSSSRWTQGIQPVWSLDPLWVPVASIRCWRFFAAGQVPLSRLHPTRVVQRSVLAKQGRPWQRNRNVDGGRLHSAAGIFRSGFGVHAHNELHFPLPKLSLAFHSQFGLDRLSNEGGCVLPTVKLEAAGGDQDVLAQTPAIVGSDTVVELTASIPASESTARQLVLQVGDAHQQRPTGADPWDIRDAANWLRPTLTFSRPELTAAIRPQMATQIAAWDPWDVQYPLDEPIQFVNIWDEVGSPQPSYRTAVAVQGQAPLVLTRTFQPPLSAKWLVLGVSRLRDAPQPPRVRISSRGHELGSFTVPLVNRDHLSLPPLVVPLPAASELQDTAIPIQIEQFPGSSQLPVQWHSIHLATTHPSTIVLYDEREKWTATNPTDATSPTDCQPSDQEAYSGQTSIGIQPPDEFQRMLQQPVDIREYPAWGEYRYLHFAVRKSDGGQVQLRLITSQPEQPDVGYLIGAAAPDRGRMLHVPDQELSDRWVAVTCDLARDFGPLQLVGIAVRVRDGQQAKLDSVVLTRHKRFPAPCQAR